MPLPEDSSQGTPLERLRDYLRQWQAATDKLSGIQEGEGAYPSEDSPDARDLEGQIGELKRIIDRILVNHPGLADVALRHDYKLPDNLPQVDPTEDDREGMEGDSPSGGGGTQTSDTEVERERENEGGEGKGSGGGGKQKANPGNRGFLLPGIKGKDFDVVRYNGKTYVSYFIKVKGQRINMTMRVPSDKLGAYGLKQGEGKQISRAHFKKLNYFGSAADLIVHGENRHPFRTFIDDAVGIYGGTGLLKNKEVVATMLAGYAQGWSQERLAGELRQTKWAQSTTDYQKGWINKSKAQKQSEINTARVTIQETLKQAFGDDWTKYFPDAEKKLDKWAEKAAMGTLHAMGDPTKALTWFGIHMQHKAERIENTPAWITKQQQLVDDRNFKNRPEEAFEALREQVVTQLGYSGREQSRMDEESLKRWAGLVASGKRSQADFDQHLRKIKQSLFPYIDPDQSFMDFASPFKSQAESLLGRSLSWDDQLLRDFTKVNANGEPVKDGAVSMTGWDFERAVRGDKRFLDSRTASDESGGILRLIDQKFFGIGA